MRIPSFPDWIFPNSKAIEIGHPRRFVPTRFLHSADWQLGKPFGSLEDDAKRHRLKQERLDVIGRLAKLVQETDSAFVVVAGDLFDSPHVTKATVSAACAALGALKVPVLAIPGNHDHGGPGSLWEQEFFRREQHHLAPNLRVLLEPKPVVLETAILFPAPLLRRHEPGNPVAWIREAARDPDLPDSLPRIVLAHGTVQGFGSPQEDEDGAAALANWIDLSALPSDALDYIALGDWHGTKQVAEKAWYSGTPEIDRFPKGEGNDPGNVLCVTTARGEAPHVERQPTGRFQWMEQTFRFSDDASLATLAAQLDARIGPHGEEHLLHLTLEGTLGIEASGELEKILESWNARLLRLKLTHRVTLAPTDDEIGALTQRVGDPILASVAAQLVTEAQGDTEEALIARLALRELHAVLS